MSLSVYFSHDIGRLVVAQVVATLQQSDGRNFEYVRGRLSGLQSVALSVGLDWGELAATAKESIQSADMLQSGAAGQIAAGGQ